MTDGEKQQNGACLSYCLGEKHREPEKQGWEGKKNPLLKRETTDRSPMVNLWMGAT